MRLMTGIVAALATIALGHSLEAAQWSIVGSFEVVGGYRGGEELPEEEWKGLNVTFTRDTIATVKEERKLYAAKYRVVGPYDEVPGAIMIDMTSTIPKKGQKARGLVHVDQKKGQARLIYGLPGKPRPDDFETGEGELMFKLKPLAEPVSIE